MLFTIYGNGPYLGTSFNIPCYTIVTTMTSNNNNKNSNRGLASADEETRERVARAGGEAADAETRKRVAREVGKA